MERVGTIGCMVAMLGLGLLGCGGEADPRPAAVSQVASAPTAPPERPRAAAPREEVSLATTVTPTVAAPSRSIPAPRVVAPSVARPDVVHVRRLVVATGVEAREPVGESDLIAADSERVYAFLDVANGGPAETLVVTFRSADGERVVGHVEVEVPAETGRWRTWAFTRHLSPGRWSAEVHDTRGQLLEARSFEVR